MDKLDTLAAIAINLTAILSAEDRYQRLLDALHIAIPYDDTAALLRVQGDVLVPLAAKGLTPDAMGREYSRQIAACGEASLKEPKESCRISALLDLEYPGQQPTHPTSSI